jgi:hypothetical protein
MNSTANYSGSGSFADDTLIFNNTSVVNATATADLTCARVVIASNYSGAWSIASRVLTTKHGMAGDGGGTMNIGNGITLSSDGSLHVNPTGALTSSSCIVTFSGGIDTFDNDKGGNWKNLIVAANAKVLNTSAAATTLLNGTGTLKLNGGTKFTGNQASALSIAANAVCTAYVASPTDTLTGTGAITHTITAANTKLSVVNYKYIGSGVQKFSNFSNMAGDTIVFYGDNNIGTAQIDLRNTGSAILFDSLAPNATLTCGGMNYGTSNTGTLKLSLGNAIINTSSTFTESSTGSNVLHYNSATWYHQGGGFARASPSPGDTIYPGTGKQYFIGSTNITANTTNHKSGQPSVIDSMESTAKLTLGDSMYVDGDLLLKKGKFSSGVYNMYITGDFRTTSADSVNTGTGRYTLTKTNAVFERKNASPLGLMKGTSFVFTGGVSFDLDTNMTLYNMKLTAGKKMSITSGRTLKDSTYTAGDLEGTRTTYSRLDASVAGSRATLDIPTAIDTIMYDTLKDISLTNAIICDSCVDGGNNLNVTFVNSTSLLPRGPTITTQPQNATAIQGSSASFSVTASGTAPFSYQWKKNGSSVGTSSASYSFTTARIDTSAKIMVIVTDANGSTNSDTATLRVKVTPVIDSIRPLNKYRSKLFDVYGYGFKNGPGLYAATIGGQDLGAMKLITDTHLQDTIPANATRGKKQFVFSNADTLSVSGAESLFVRIPYKP